MRRRDFCALLLPASQLSSAGTALLVSVGARQIIYKENPQIAEQWLIRPGSTVKPFTLITLIRAGKLSPLDVFPCPGVLSLNGQNLNCSHPKLALPMNAARALAYSCNCAIAHFAERLRPGELRQTLKLFGFTRITDPASLDAQKLQAIGHGLECRRATHLAVRVRQSFRGEESPQDHKSGLPTLRPSGSLPDGWLKINAFHR